MIRKRIIFLVLAGFGIFLAATHQPAGSVTIFMTDNLTLQNQGLVETSTNLPVDSEPETAQFAFDYDDTLAKMSIIKMGKLIASIRGLIAIAELNIEIPRFVYLCMKDMDAFRTFCRYETQYPNAANLLADLENSQHPMPGMIEILDSLQGFEKNIATNKKHRSFDRLKLNPDVAPVLARIDRYFMVNNTVTMFEVDTADLEKKKPAASWNKEKPDAGYYEFYQETFNPNNKLVIFVDDKLKNIEGAIKAMTQWNANNPDKPQRHWIAIHFKSADQLAQDLQDLGFPVSRNCASNTQPVTAE
jgi:phosphoglycolate phosphatase-like HAD superfamily hydrolase